MEVEGIWIKIGAKIDQVLEAFQQVQNMAKVQMANALRDVGGTITDYVSKPLIALGTTALKVGSEMEQTKIAFTTMLGSGEKATKFLGELKAFAAGTPFEFPGLVDSARRLQALGFEADKVIPSLRAIGNASAALGGGAQMIDRVTLALGQMTSKGKVSAQEINQLAESGIGAWKILAEGMGKKIPEVMALAEKGMINAGRAVPEILASLNKQFDGMMEKQAKTIAGQWSNVKDQITFILMDLGEALAPTAQRMLDALSPMIKVVEGLVAAFKDLSPEAQAVIVGLAAILAAIGPILVALGTLGLAVSSMSTGLATLGVTAITAKGAIAGLGGVAAAAAAAFAAWKLGEWLYKNVDAVKRFGDMIGDLILKIPGVEKFIESMNGVPAATKSFADQVSILEAKLKAKGIVIDKTGLSMEEYSKRLRNVVLGIAPTTAAVTKSTDENKKNEQSWLHTGNAMEGVKNKAKEVAQAIETGWHKVGEILAGLPKSFNDFQQAMSKGANFDAVLAGLTKQIHDIDEGFRSKIPDAISKGMALHLVLAKNKLIEFKQEADRIALAEAFEKANNAVFNIAQNLQAVGKAGMDYLNTVGLSAISMANTAMQQVNALDQSFKNIGVTWSGTLVSSANKAKHEFEGIVLAMEAGMVSAVDFQLSVIKYLEAQIAANKATGDSWVELQEQLDSAKRKLGELTGEGDKAADSLKKSSKNATEAASGMSKAWGDFGKQVSTILTDFGKDIATSIVHAKNFGDAATKAATAIKEAFMRLIVEGAIKEMAKGLDGISGMLGGLGQKLNGLFSGLFGGGGGGGGTSPSNGGGGGLGGLGGAGSPISLVTGISTAITGFMSMLQGRRMEQDIGRIEVSSRGALSQLISLQETFNKWLPYMENLIQLQRLEGIEETIRAGLGSQLLGGLLDAFTDVGEAVMELPRDLMQGMEESIGRPITRVATAVMEQGQQMSRGTAAAFEALGRALSGALGGPQLLTEIRTLRLTQNEQLRIIGDGVWATYSAVAKTGFTTPTRSGSPSVLPTSPGSPDASRPNTSTTVVNVNNPRTTDPYTLGLQTGAGLNAVLPVRF